MLHYFFSGGSRLHWVSMCTVWLSKSKWLSKYSNESVSNFVLSLKIPLWNLLGWFRRLHLWASDDWQLHNDNRLAHASHLVQSFLAKHQITHVTQPLYSPDLVPCDFWLFPKTKMTLEREEISDHRWDSGKYNGAADGDWICVRSRRAYFEGDWGVIVLCTMFLVSCVFF